MFKGIEHRAWSRILAFGVLATVALLVAVRLQGPVFEGEASHAETATPDVLAGVEAQQSSSETSVHGNEPGEEWSRSIAGARDFAVRTLDRSSRPVAGASVFASTESGVTEFGLTDADGVLVVRVPADLGWFGASKTGYATAFARIAGGSEASGSEVLLMLDSECTIVGIVRSPDGVTPRVPVTVHAWPESIRPTAAWLRFRGQMAPLRATMDAEGQFELRGLSRGERYCVTASASGCVADSIECTTAPAIGLELKLKWVFALDVRAVDSKGQHVRTSGDVHGFRGTTWQEVGESDELSQLQVNDLRAMLIGLDSGVQLVGDSGRNLLIYLRNSGGAVGPIAMTWRVPGYAPKDVELLVPRLESATPRVELVQLESRVECWGAASIQISFGEERVDTSLLALGRLRLSGIDSEETYSLAVRRAETRTVDGIPCGSYRASLQVRDLVEIGTADGLPVTIRADSEASLKFDLSALGTINVHFAHSSERAYEGVVNGYLVHNERVWVPVQFKGAPYVVTGLPSGTYGLRVTSPACLAGSAVAPPVNLPEGESANLKVIWSD